MKNNTQVDLRLKATLVDQLYQRSLGALSINILNPLVLAYVFKDSAPALFLYSWLGSGFFMVACRVALIFWYRRSRPIKLEHVSKWQNWYVLGAFAGGIFWGSSVFLLFCGAPEAKLAFYIFLMAGMVSGSLAMYYLSLLTFYAFALPTLLALFLAFLIKQTQASTAMAVVVGIYFVVLAFIFKQINRATVESYILRFEKEDMAEKLVLEKSEIQKLNQVLEQEITSKYKVQMELQKSKHDLQMANTKLISINDKLEQMVRTNRAIAVKAESANAAKSIFLANMSHEVRTPLCGIIGLCELMDATHMDDAQQDYMGMIAGSAQGLLAVINNILDFSRIEAGKMEIAKNNIDLETFLGEINKLMAFEPQNKGIEYICCIKPDVPSEIVADRIRLRQILINVIGNAVKFTDSGSIKVSIGVEEFAGAMELVALAFEVADTGIGIEEDKMGKIFSAFTQANSGVMKKYGGTGLGLSISKKLVELMGGNIEVHSSYGRGTTVKIHLQVGIGEDDKRDKEAFKGIRFLIVSPNKYLIPVIKLMTVAQEGLIECVETGDEALLKLKKLHEEKYSVDVLIIDASSNKEQGLELTKIVKNKDYCVDMKVVLLCNIAQKQDIIGLGPVDAVLCKPVCRREFINSVLVVMGRKKLVADALAPKKPREIFPEINGMKDVRVLVVEDDSVNRELLEQIIIKIGCNVQSVANGEKAIDALSREDYGLVFMDFQMPGMDGLRTVKEIRSPWSKVKNHNIPIVGVSAHTSETERRACFAAGMNDFLPKPFSFARIVEKIQHWGI